METIELTEDEQIALLYLEGLSGWRHIKALIDFSNIRSNNFWWKILEELVAKNFVEKRIPTGMAISHEPEWRSIRE